MAHCLLLGTRKGLLIGRPNGAWDLHFPGVPVEYAMVDPRNGWIWASLDHGHWGVKLHSSPDGGATWREHKAPAYSPGDQWNDHWNKRMVDATLKNIWTIVPGAACEPGRLYFGTNPGGLFTTEDNGETIHLVRGLWDLPSRLGDLQGKPGWFGGGRDNPGIHSILVDPRNPAHLTVAISCGGVLRSEDHGLSWKPQNQGLPAPFVPDPDGVPGQDPHCIEACAAQPDVVWMQHHMGIFCSTDAGRSWSEKSVPPARFGFPIVAHPTDPLRAWVVPATADEQRQAVDGRLQVCETHDGGSTWISRTEGLPQTLAFDLVYRHAFAGAGDGLTLAFGSTTGNVYRSTDGGCSWHNLGTHFPPVYSVRFGELPDPTP